MGQDRMVEWTDNIPDKEQIRMALEDYIGDKGSVSWSDECRRWFITLPGVSSHPLQRLLGEVGPVVTMTPECMFEVFVDEEYLDVITRGQSPLINAIADGFVTFACDFWHAQPEKEESHVGE